MSRLPVPSMMMKNVKYRPLTKQNNHIGSPVYSGPHDGLSGKCDTIINKSGPLDNDAASPRLDTGEAPSVW